MSKHFTFRFELVTYNIIFIVCGAYLSNLLSSSKFQRCGLNKNDRIFLIFASLPRFYCTVVLRLQCRTVYIRWFSNLVVELVIKKYIIAFALYNIKRRLYLRVLGTVKFAWVVHFTIATKLNDSSYIIAPYHRWLCLGCFLSVKRFWNGEKSLIKLWSGSFKASKRL